MFDQDTRLRVLSTMAMEGTLSEAEFTELSQLSKAKRKLREDRLAMIAGLRETLQSQGIAIRDIFSEAEIAAAAPLDWSLPGRRVARKNLVRLPRTEGTWVRQKAGLALVEVYRDGVNGLPCRYCKGQLLPYYVSKGLKLLDDGQLEANLERNFTAEGRTYFATDGGRVELERLIDYIRTHEMKPHLK